MRAYVLTSFGTPPEFREVAPPSPAPGEVLVRVHATSVNPVDALVRDGFFRAAQEYRFPAVFGRDVAGVVEDVGRGVSRFAVGDEVFGFVKREYIGNGTFAEYVVVPEDMGIARRPRQATLLESGTLGMGGVTALECVDAVIVPGDNRILVTGAAGGLGSHAVQIARARGATVVAAVRSDAAAHHVAELGADMVLDTREGDLVDLVRRRAPDGITGVVDLLKRAHPRVMGENESAARAEFARLCRGVLVTGGRAASVTNGGEPDRMGDVHFTNVHSTPSPASLSALAALVDSGRVRPVVDTVHGFADIAAAFAQLAAGGLLGKIAVQVRS